MGVRDILAIVGVPAVMIVRWWNVIIPVASWEGQTLVTWHAYLSHVEVITAVEEFSRKRHPRVSLMLVGSGHSPWWTGIAQNLPWQFCTRHIIPNCALTELLLEPPIGNQLIKSHSCWNLSVLWRTYMSGRRGTQGSRTNLDAANGGSPGKNIAQ